MTATEALQAYREAREENGRRRALDRLLHALQPEIQRVARRMVPSSVADDVAQEAMLAIAGKLDQLREDAAVEGWAAQITRQKALMHHRRTRALAEVSDDEHEHAEESESTPELEADGGQEQERMLDAIADLHVRRERFAAVLQISRRGGGGVEIAEAWLVSQDAARKLLQRARAALAEVLRDGPEVKAHPAAAIFPMLPLPDLESLANDIRQHGLLQPIVLHEGMILDGRNRLRACALAGVQPTFAEWSGRGDSPTAWVLAVNLQRRHLNETQRAVVAAKASKLMEAEGRELLARARGPVAMLPKSVKRRSRDRAAATANVGSRLVGMARRVLRHGAPELVAALEAGRVRASTAARLTVLDHARQAELVAEGEAAMVRASWDLLALRHKAQLGKLVNEPPVCPGCGRST
jgi:RNA polymerase sigma factor (sigma-70 family)